MTFLKWNISIGTSRTAPGLCVLGWLDQNSASVADKDTSYLQVPLSSKPHFIFVSQDLFPL